MKKQYFKLNRTGEVCKRVYSEDGVTFHNEPNLDLQHGDILAEIEPDFTDISITPPTQTASEAMGRKVAKQYIKNQIIEAIVDDFQDLRFSWCDLEDGRGRYLLASEVMEGLLSVLNKHLDETNT